MPRLSDSDPEKWKYDLHTQIKHQILATYLDSWTTILGSRHRSLVYVDGFAGRAHYSKGEAGSPLLALDAVLAAMSKRKGVLNSVTCYFAEADLNNFTDLKRELEAYPPAKDPRISYELYNEPFSAASEKIVAKLGRLRHPSFFFVDPFGYDDPTMDKLGEILRLSQTELFINLMYDFVNRGLHVRNQPALAATLSRLFGANEWQQLITLPKEEREDALVELYRQQLKRRGAKYVIPFRMGDDLRERTIYYLLYATKHPLGAKVMKDAMIASATRGQLAYAGQQRHQLIPLINFDVEQLSTLVLEKFAGRTLSFLDVIAESSEETGVCKESDYRRCLKQLEAEGRLAIRRIVSKKSGWANQDLISFPPESAG